MTGEPRASPRDEVIAAFRTHFSRGAEAVATAPGRVNLIGEHTDYNDGFVLPMAIDRGVWIALAPRSDGVVRIHSLDFGETREAPLDTLERGEEGWWEYVKGVAWALAESGHHLTGFDGVMRGTVPIGAGLSSSAALELATARAFAHVSGLSWEPAAMALTGQRAENGWVGVNCGIMDQMISSAGEAGRALLIDCRTLHTQAAPLPRGLAVVVMDTATRRGLVESAYNERRAQCEAAARHFGVRALRDVSSAELAAAGEGLDPLILRRARHVVTENERTLAAVEALAAGDEASFGAHLDASHASLRDDFEVSRRELDVMVEIAGAAEGCIGARMTGAGFGGCAVAVVREAEAEGFVADVTTRYAAATGLQPALYVCRASAGAAIETL